MKRLLLAVPLALASPLALAALNLSMSGLVDTVIWLIIIGAVLGLLIFLVRKAPFIPPEWKQGIEYFIYFVAVIAVINLLLGMAGYPLVNLK